MKNLTIAEAVREALDEEMMRNDEVFILGEDIGVAGGTLGVTRGLHDKYPGRVLDTPIAETGILGIALGAAYAGMKAVAEIMYADFIGVVYDYVLNQATKNRYMTGMQEGGKDCCMVLRAPCGAGFRKGSQHSQCIEQLLMPIPGITIITPATAADAKGLMKSALRGNDPVVFLEHKVLNFAKSDVPEDEDYLLPIGKAVVKREGTDVTIVANQMMLLKSLKAAEELATLGINAEVVDLMTVKPIDMETIMTSVRKTGYVVLANEASSTGNIMSEIANRIVTEGFDILKAAPVKVCGPDTPTPFTPNLEDVWIRSDKDVVEAVKTLLGK